MIIVDPSVIALLARIDWKQIKKALEKPQEFMDMILQYDFASLTPKVM